MARSEQVTDVHVRTHGKKRQGFSRKSDAAKNRVLYPTDPAALRQLNSAVNKQHSRGWVSVDEG